MAFYPSRNEYILTKSMGTWCKKYFICLLQMAGLMLGNPWHQLLSTAVSRSLQFEGIRFMMALSYSGSLVQLKPPIYLLKWFWYSKYAILDRHHLLAYNISLCFEAAVLHFRYCWYIVFTMLVYYIISSSIPSPPPFQPNSKPVQASLADGT